MFTITNRRSLQYSPIFLFVYVTILDIFFRFFNIVSTASPKLQTLFETYNIKNIEAKNYSQINEVLRKAMEKSYGPQVKLNLQFIDYDKVFSFQQKKMLTNYKENIISLNIPLWIDPEILLWPDLKLTNIERLIIDFYGVEHSFHICENIIARYADKLEHLSVKKLKNPDNTVLQVPNLTKLKSLTLIYVDNKIMNTFVNAVNKEFITHLSLSDIDGHCVIPRFGNLQYLKLAGISGDAALSLIMCNKGTISELIMWNFNFTDRNNANINIPKLRQLELYRISGDAALSLIKCNKDTINKLRLSCVDFRNSDNLDINISNLSQLKLENIYGDALSLIKCNKDTVTELRLRGVDFKNRDDADINISKLRHLGLCRISEDAAQSLIKCNKDTITELGLEYVNFTDSINTDIYEININNLRQLKLEHIYGDAALSLIKCNRETITELILWSINFTNTSLPDVEMPRLKHLYLRRYENDYEYQIRLLTKAFGRNLTVLWTFDHDILTYKWISTEELKNIKIRALALH